MQFPIFIIIKKTKCCGKEKVGKQKEADETHFIEIK